MTERERRAFNRGLQKAIEIAQIYADELWHMHQHTLLADPVLMRRATRETIVEDAKKSEQLLIQGHGHACAAHAAQNIIKALKEAKAKP